MEKSAINKIKSHILVVDDDNRLRKLLQKFLTDNGFSVDTAQNTSIARKKITAILYDIIILDVMMPGESGLSFLQYLRTISSTPILMLSAMKDTKERIKGLKIVADDSLGKPSFITPKSVVVPPISTTIAFVCPDKKAAPLMLFVGPEAKVKTG